MTIFAIESSCDETSVAVVREGVVLASKVASQTRLHSEYGGVVPELATREHLANFLPVAREALSAAGVEARALDAVAATRGPGLPNALLTGYKAGQAMALALGCPFLGIHHHEAHLYSPWIGGNPPRAMWERMRPNVSLIVSGGHTLLVHVRGLLDHGILGETLDDAAGECFDKVAKLLGLSYPGGPEMDRMAKGGDPLAFQFPRPLIKEPNHDFSFAGLKTSVRYYLDKHAEARNRLPDLCASVQEAIVDVLVRKLLRAAAQLGVGYVSASGGVSCNSRLRERLRNDAASAGVEVVIADPTYCTDNAAMIGVLAEAKWKAGAGSDSLDSEVEPRMALR